MMTSFLILLLASFLGCVISWPTPLTIEEGEDAEHLFEKFTRMNNRSYVDEHEKQARLEIFKANLEEVKKTNTRRNNRVIGVSQFMDLTLEEFRRQYTGYKAPGLGKPLDCPLLHDRDVQGNDIPESFDWRDHNILGPAKDQKNCGSCYAFSAMGNVQAQYAKKHKKILDLSEQQIIDCDQKSNGCSSGFPDSAFKYLMDNGGAVSESDYPYQDAKGQCRVDTSKAVVKVTGCRAYQLTSQEKVKQLLVQNGPLSIAMRSDGLHLRTHEGIVTEQDCNPGTENHAVLLVGYGNEGGQPYWIVKNSWGPTRLEQGYFRMHQGGDSCGMMKQLMYTVEVA